MNSQHPFPPGSRVQWTPERRTISDYGARRVGTVADAPAWPPIDTRIEEWSDPRIPVDLDTPLRTWPQDGCG